VFLDDSPETIKEKVKRAVTDSETVIRYDAKAKLAISNLLRIYAALGDELIPDLEKKFQNMNYSEFKLGLGNLIANYFEPFRLRKKVLLKSPALIKSALKAGSAKANRIASKKISEAKKKVGLAV
jgi:tryptophanyl-tRNA synthetase